MRVLVTHEESGVVREAFRKRGHDAWSNDLIPARDGSPYHLQMDAVEAVTQHGPWDIIISHIECTEMAVSGNRWYGKGTPGSLSRTVALRNAVAFWELIKKHALVGCALENPVSVLWQYIGQPQYIQLWKFGHKECKKTGILTHRLPLLAPTNDVGPPPPAGSEERKSWEVVWRMTKSATRKRDRSETRQGVADAFAEQWGGYDLTMQNLRTPISGMANMSEVRCEV